MQAIIKHILGPGAENLETFSPENPTDVLLHLQIIIGPANTDGAESFGLDVVTTGRLERLLREAEVVSGRHMLIVHRYNTHTVLNWIERTVSACTGATWDEIAQNLARYFAWEFEDLECE